MIDYNHGGKFVVSFSYRYLLTTDGRTPKFEVKFRHKMQKK